MLLTIVKLHIVTTMSFHITADSKSDKIDSNTYPNCHHIPALVCPEITNMPVPTSETKLIATIGQSTLAYSPASPQLDPKKKVKSQGATSAKSE